MTRPLQVQTQLPLLFAAEEIGQEQGIVITRVERAPQQHVDLLIEIDVAVVGRTASRQQPLPPRTADIVFEFSHERADLERCGLTIGGHCAGATSSSP
jgi:hypothetical protein